MSRTFFLIFVVVGGEGERGKRGGVREENFYFIFDFIFLT